MRGGGSASVVRLAGMEEAAEVAVAKASGGKRPAADGGEEGQVVGVADAKGADTTTAIRDGAGDLVEEVVERRAVVHGGQSLEVGFVGPLRDRGTAVKVRDALPQRAPGELTAARAGGVRGAEHLAPAARGLGLRPRKCLHIYKYYLHPVFGFIHARLPTPDRSGRCGTRGDRSRAE
jgi:hypothetical protein